MESSGVDSYSRGVSEVTQILKRAEQGDPKAAHELLPLVYEELRKLAGREDGPGTARPNPASHLDANNLTPEDFAGLNLNGFMSFEPINAGLEIDGTVVPIDTSASSPYLSSGYVS